LRSSFTILPLIGVLVLFAWLFSACTDSVETTVAADTPMEVTPTESTATDTPPQPSATPEPPAAVVNGEPISVSAFQAELARYIEAAGEQAGETEQQQVLESMIDHLLLAQEAEKQGFNLNEAELDERLNGLIERLGSRQVFDEWMAANGYNEASFRTDLETSVKAAWMRDQVIAAVSSTAEQIHARQILSTSLEEAEQVYAQLQGGSDFGRLADQADPITGGELGWFPRGYLFYPELDDAVFPLEPGKFTGIVQTPVGYHILLVVERDPNRPLTPDALLQAQHRALESWLEETRQQSEVVIP